MPSANANVVVAHAIVGIIDIVKNQGNHQPTNICLIFCIFQEQLQTVPKY